MLNQQEANGDIEVVETPEPKGPGLPPSFKMVMVGMDMATGACQIEKDDAAVPTWEIVIAILSAAIEVARFHRNMGHGMVLQANAMKAIEEEQIKQALRQKGKIHV